MLFELFPNLLLIYALPPTLNVSESAPSTRIHTFKPVIKRSIPSVSDIQMEVRLLLSHSLQNNSLTCVNLE